MDQKRPFASIINMNKGWKVILTASTPSAFCDYFDQEPPWAFFRLILYYPLTGFKNMFNRLMPEVVGDYRRGLPVQNQKIGFFTGLNASC